MEQQPAAVGSSVVFDNPRQQRIHRLLLEFIGPGQADQYEDARRLLGEQPPHKTTVHLVAHLLREIESAVRSVCAAPQPSTTPVECDTCGVHSGHQASISDAMAALKFENDEPIGQLWRSTIGLEKLAHRNNFSTRTINREFLDLCETFDVLLDVVLPRFADLFRVAIERVGALRQKVTPSKADYAILRRRLPNHHSVYGAFFADKLPDRWSALLLRMGFFSPPPENATEASFSYACRFVGEEPTTSHAIVSKLPTPRGFQQIRDFIGVILVVSPVERKDLFPKLLEAVHTEPRGSKTFRLLVDELGKVAAQLARDGFIEDASSLVRLLVAATPTGSETA